MHEPCQIGESQHARAVNGCWHILWVIAIAVVTATIGLVCGTTPVSAADRSKLEFNRDVRPILAENCFACHGPDSAARKGDLRLDHRDEAIKAGAITPGNTDSSELLAGSAPRIPRRSCLRRSRQRS